MLPPKPKSTARSVACLILASLLVACAAVQRPEPAPGAQAPAELSRSPFKEPPGVFSTDVTQSNTGATICVSGWTATVRPPTSYSQALKKAMMARANLDPANVTMYELDHFVPLALGGHPRSEDNLWLQPWEGDWNARIKDRLERTLQVMVCAGRLSLDTARTAIQRGWHAAYTQYVGPAPVAASRGMRIDDEEVGE